ncbi:retrotransposon protein, putative, ty1-copia subclass [Tanacetum coccineum]
MFCWSLNVSALFVVSVLLLFLSCALDVRGVLVGWGAGGGWGYCVVGEEWYVGLEGLDVYFESLDWGYGDLVAYARFSVTTRASVRGSSGNSRGVSAGQYNTCSFFNSQCTNLKKGKPVAAYVRKMKGYVEQLERLGYELPQDLSVGLILNSLTSDFARFVRNYNMHNMGKTIGELYAMLIEYEKGKGKANGKGKDKQVYIPKPTNPKPSAKEKPTKDDTYHHYKEVGHWKRNCLVYLAKLLKKKKQVGIASSSVSKYDVLYFNAIPRDGIYEIDMHNLVPNVNSIYTVSNKRAKHNLDSTYLWYCHLAHISKKHIENMQQEGLLKSTDDESIDQCVSCLLGKMTRKPFPHRTERETGLLGIIHTDVCHPLRHVSRQGASYFITFTDDYSCYGYVYLLKHKYEVFETFKVFKNEVENQLGKTIKAL